MLSAEARELFAALVATPSASSADSRYDQGNRAVAELLANRFEDAGFDVELLPLSYDPGKCNVLARRGSGEGGLMLAGHSDTVPCDETAWNRDPLRLIEQNGRLYGLGASDMKNFFPIVFDALDELPMRRQKQPLYLLATADEESNMGGVGEFAATDRDRARHALIGEPTGLVPVNAHKGVLMESVRLIGRSAHASEPERGNSALEGMYRVFETLFDWRVRLQERYRDERFSVATPTLNIGSVHGGDSANRICGACEAGIDLRLLPGMAPEALRRELRARVERAVAGRNLHLECRPLFAGVPAMQTPAKAPIVKLAQELAGCACTSANFATEGGTLNGLGMDTVILGAGDIAQAHGPDEYLAVERIAPMIRIVRGMVQRLCLEAVP